VKETIKQLLVGILLLGAGLISPSNGIDDKVDREPLQMLIETGIIILIAILLYSAYHFLLEPRTRIEERK
jgi:hypothetical protein